jgi:ribosomal protein S18 acetylase RimI-like enzyme
VIIRRAVDADWPRIWPIWHEVVARGDTYTYDPATTSDEARASWLAGSPDEAWIAVDDDDRDVLGTYHIAANQPGPGSHVANASYMVDSAVRGRGIGRALVIHSLERAADAGYRGVQFNAVAATNVGAIGLYRSLGFTTIGLVPGGFRHPYEGYVDLHVMYRSVP